MPLKLENLYDYFVYYKCSSSSNECLDWGNVICEHVKIDFEICGAYYGKVYIIL